MLQNLVVKEQSGTHYWVEITANDVNYMTCMTAEELRKKQLEMRAEKLGFLSLLQEIWDSLLQ